MRKLKLIFCLLIILLIIAACGRGPGAKTGQDNDIEEEVTEETIENTVNEEITEIYTTASKESVTYIDDLEGYLCIPEGTGPHAAAIFNHGGRGGIIGGDPEAVCEAVADLGYVGFSPVRSDSMNFNNIYNEIIAGFDYVQNLDYVDPDKITIMGFSRGAMLTYQASTELDIAAVVLMAPAPPLIGQEDEYYAAAENVDAPIFILVSENDLPEYNNEGEDHVALSEELKEALEAAYK